MNVNGRMARFLKPRLHGNTLRGRPTCCRQHVACISVTYIPLYPATDGQQTGNNFVAVNMLLVATCLLQHVALL